MKTEKTIQNDCIQVVDATENNLKHINLSIPLKSFICVTGCSGCGKSSLVFDTIYAESQRAFLESMSENLYGQKFLSKPKVGAIYNLRPALNLSQSSYNINPRSTVGSFSEISLYLRGLFAIISSSGMKKYSEKHFSSYAIGSCCPKCLGTGEEYSISEELVVPDKNKKLVEGGITYFKGGPNSFEFKSLEALCEYFGIDINKKISELSEKEYDFLLYSKEKIKVKLRYKSNGVTKQQTVYLQGAITKLNEKLSNSLKNENLTGVSKYVEKKACSKCNGMKLNDQILEIKVCNLNIAEVERLSFNNLIDWLDKVQNEYINQRVYELVFPIIAKIKKKIEFLFKLNLSYLSLSRSIPSLSSGEKQRLRFSNQMGCPLHDLIYILDEPCKGLHSRDIKFIVESTKELVNKENTVIAIEHNKQYLKESQKIIQLGPVGGPNGGFIIDSNVNVDEKLLFKETTDFKKFIEISNINFRTIRNQSVKIPVGGITCITGVSGSGKSTLLSVIFECIDKKINFHCNMLKGSEEVKSVYYVNQNPIGKTPRSTIMSYLELSNEIRNIFASTKAARELKIPANHFSINVEGGRCECCQGTGLKKIEMNYLPTYYILCPECEGKRFSNHILDIKYKGINIQQLLDSSIVDIVDLFSDNAKILSVFQCIINLGIGYLKLGQMSMNLSGGEAQRLKLAKALSVFSKVNNLFLLDEPTSGLSEIDYLKLKDVLLKLQSKGNTIVLIEHNIEFISSIADYVIDFGLFGGELGGKIVSAGSTRDVIYDKASSWYGLVE